MLTEGTTPRGGRPKRIRPIGEYIWKNFNTTKKTLYSRFSNGTPYPIKPGHRIIIPVQLEFIESLYEYDAVLYGGARGGGKTHILMWSLVYILLRLALEKGIKNARVAIFSYTFNDSIRRHVNEIPNYFPEWLGKVYRSVPAEYHLAEEFGGGIIQFLNLSDPEQYKSVQFAAVAIDELTENNEEVFNHIIGSKRYPGVDFVPLICATNPNGPGRAWVKRRFVDEATRDRPEYNPKYDHWSKGFRYIQALPDDNPILPDAYKHDLSRLPEKLKRAYYEGDWEVFDGQYFNLDRNVHLFTPMDIPQEWRRFRAIDAGYAHPTVCLWGAVDPEGTLWVYREYSSSGEDNVNHDARWHKKRIAALSIDRATGDPEDYVMTVGDPSMWRSDRSHSGNITWREVFDDRNDGIGSFRMTKARATEKRDGWFALLEGLGYEYSYRYDEEKRPYKVYSRRPRIRISTECPRLFESLNNCQHDEKNPDVVKKTTGNYEAGEGDDEADTLRYLYLAAVKSKYDTKGAERKRFQAADRTRDDYYNRDSNISIWAQ